MKRLLDLVVAIVALGITAPIFLGVAVGLRGIGQDVFFRQRRSGRGGQRFAIWKFTTMPKGAEKLGDLTAAGDSRPFTAGRVLRATKVNELPQLFNVLLGDMSLVGPRPLLANQVAAYPQEVRQVIAKLRPGVTGIGSLFFRREDQILALANDPYHFYDNVVLPTKGALEVWYFERHGLRIDILTILLTIAGTLTRRIMFPRAARAAASGFLDRARRTGVELESTTLVPML